MSYLTQAYLIASLDSKKRRKSPFFLLTFVVFSGIIFLMKNKVLKALLFINNHAFLWLWFCLAGVLYCLYNLYQNLDENSFRLLIASFGISIVFAINYLIKSFRYSTYINPEQKEPIKSLERKDEKEPQPSSKTPEQPKISQEIKPKNTESPLTPKGKYVKIKTEAEVKKPAPSKTEKAPAPLPQEVVISTKTTSGNKGHYISNKKKSKDLEFKQKVIDYRNKYPYKTQSECSDDLGISISTVRRWWHTK